jgi:hypothetical protein
LSRYYDITIGLQGGSPISVWSSHPNGVFDPAAANVEFDMPVLPYDTPSGGQSILIEGVSLQQISQAQQLTGMQVTIKGGMQKGLPLANPAQAGTLVQGQIFQSFGNWEGTQMELAMVILPSPYSMQNTKPIVLPWAKGQPLSDALNQMFATSFPGMPVSMNIGSNLVATNDSHHFDYTLEGIAYKVSDLTEQLFQQKVYITIQCGKIVVFDSTYQPSPIQIAFMDLIGQPTWINVNTMQVKTVMRADLQVGGMITMPQGIQNAPGLVSTTQAALPSSIKYQSAFQNTFQITELRHVGNYRATDASAWCTILNCVTSAPNG